MARSPSSASIGGMALNPNKSAIALVPSWETWSSWRATTCGMWVTPNLELCGFLSGGTSICTWQLAGAGLVAQTF